MQTQKGQHQWKPPQPQVKTGGSHFQGVSVAKMSMPPVSSQPGWAGSAGGPFGMQTYPGSVCLFLLILVSGCVELVAMIKVCLQPGGTRGGRRSGLRGGPSKMLLHPNLLLLDLPVLTIKSEIATIVDFKDIMHDFAIMKAMKYCLGYYKLHNDNLILLTQIKQCPLFMNTSSRITLTWIFEAIIRNNISEKSVSFNFRESKGRGDGNLFGAPSC